MKRFLIASVLVLGSIGIASATTVIDPNNGRVTTVDPPKDPSAHQMRIENLRDSGYNPKNDFDAYGNMKVNGAY